MISRAIRRVALCFLAVISLTAICNVAAGHDSWPLYIELREIASQRFELDWKIPPSMPLAAAPEVALSSPCTLRGPVAERRVVDGWLRQSAYDCPDGVAGNKVSIRYNRGPARIPVLIRLERQSGQQHLESLPARAETWLVPDAESRSGVAKSYSMLGFRHVLAGYDHLLFLLCLVWIAGTWKRMLLTVTGFTVAHSTTLTLSAFEIVRLPVAPVEATIALSILFLATELTKNRRNSLTWRYPVVVSTAFGLVHGLGFAAALAEAGLPQVEAIHGLLFFNVGVEIGQVLIVSAFVLTMTAFGQALRSRRNKAVVSSAFRVATSYFVGATASFWLIQRCLVL